MFRNRKIAGIFYFFVFIIFTTPVFANTNPVIGNSALKIMEFGQQLFQEDEYYRAITEFKRFLFLFPRNPETDKAHLLIAQTYYKGEKYEECADYLEINRNNIKNLRNMQEATILLGNCYIKMKRYRMALTAFQEITDNYPGDIVSDRAFLGIARLNTLQRKWERAAEAYNKIKNDDQMSSIARKAADQVITGKKLDRRNPSIAGILAAIFPGAGHLYSGRKQDAIVSFILNGAFIWGIVESFRSDKPVIGGILSFFELGWYGGNINGAVNSAYKFNEKKEADFREKIENNFNITNNNTIFPHTFIDGTKTVGGATSK